MAVKRGKKQARRNGQSSVPGWMWLLVGLLIGGAVAVVLYVKMPHAISDLMPHPNPAAHPATAGDGGVAPEGSVVRAAPAEPKKTEFDFFKVLPEREVVIPDEELSAQVKAEAAAKLASQQQVVAPTTPNAVNGVPVTTEDATPSTSPDVNPPTTTADTTPKQGQYLLQAGAFRNSAQADDLKARIALLGLVGHVETVQTSAGEMHRVRLGPYSTASALEDAKQKLSAGGLSALAVRVK